MSETHKTATDTGELRKPRRGGPSKGSQNNFRHGMKAGKLPKELAYVENRINSFRRQLEEALMTAKGAIGITDAATINTACKHERHGALALHYLRHAELSPSDVLRFSAEAAKASNSRDKCIRALNLDRDSHSDLIQALYGPPKALPAPATNGDNGNEPT
jgi:hypothetical protein